MRERGERKRTKKKMEYVYGAMLLHSTGKEINEANLKKVMQASGVKVDEARIKALVASLEGVNIDEAIQTPTQVLAPPPAQAPSAAPSAEAPAAPGKEAAAAEGEKKKEKPSKEEEEKTEEEAATGLASLFG